MAKRSSKPLAALYGAMLEKINSQFQDGEFSVRDFAYLVSGEIKHSDLSHSMSILSRKGYIKRVRKQTFDRVSVVIFKRIENPVIEPSPEEKRAMERQSIERMQEACMRLWRALRLPVVDEGVVA